MSETAQKIYEYLKTEKQYNYSQDVSIRQSEQDAVKELESNGYILVRMRTICYVIADVL